MALRNQPYLPLYIQDYLTDEKLNMCSASTQGVYVRIMCILHKQETYGRIELKSKFKNNKNILNGFAEMLNRHIQFDAPLIYESLVELIDENVMFVDGDYLCQKRMMRDFEISTKRSNAGSIGGKIGRNSNTKRYYNEPGYLYLIYDQDDSFAIKIGISADPEKRILGITRKTKRTNLSVFKKWYVKDMGFSEQIVLDYFNDIRDGEWILGQEHDKTELSNKIESLLLQEKQIPGQKVKPGKNNNPDLLEPEHRYQIAIKTSHPTIAKLKKQLTYAEAIKLESFGDDIIYDVFRAMENKNGLTKTYSTVYLTANDWAKRRLNDGSRTQAANRSTKTGSITTEDIQRRASEAGERAKYLFPDDPQGN